MQASYSIEPLVACEGNNDEKLRPLIEKHKGLFKDASGIWVAIFLLISFNAFKMSVCRPSDCIL